MSMKNKIKKEVFSMYNILSYPLYIIFLVYPKDWNDFLNKIPPSPPKKEKKLPPVESI